MIIIIITLTLWQNIFFGYNNDTDFMLRNITNHLRRNFFVTILNLVCGLSDCSIETLFRVVIQLKLRYVTHSYAFNS
jgi:hypothetical protein